MTSKNSEKPFCESDLESIGRFLEGLATHRQLESLFRDCGLTEPLPINGMPKWQRIKNALACKQNQTQTGNWAMKFIQTVASPKRLVQTEEHEANLEHINRFLAFRGWKLEANGKFDRVPAACTIDEARTRANRLHAELERRNVHPDVLKFCTAELVNTNYFHAMLEATKSVSEKLRQKTGLAGDGGSLATEALMPGRDKKPKLAFNALQTDTDFSEQKGIASLFIGMFGTFRNTTAHGPRISWPVSEQDAMDLLTLVSFLHRRLDHSEACQP